MNYNEFTQLPNQIDHLYNIVRIYDRSEMLRGASKKSVVDFIKETRKEDYIIFIY